MLNDEAIKYMRPKLGEWRLIEATLYRRKLYYTHSRTEAVWRSDPCIPEPAMYIGYRTLANGELEWIDDVGNVFYPKEHFEAWVFVFDERQRPVLVLPKEALKSPSD